MRRPARAGRQLAALVAASRAAARAHGCHPLRAARLARRVRRRQGFEYHEALRVGALDPAMHEAERAVLVSRHAALEAQAPLNGGNEVPAMTGDKVAFYRYCSAVGIPVPELLGILDARGSGWGARGRVIAGPRDREAFIAEDLPAEFVVKPAEGYAGRGVRVLRRRADGGLDGGGRATRTEVLWGELRDDPEFDVWIVQERLVNHPDLDRLGGAGTLHSVRIVTLVGDDGRARPLFAMLKLAVSGAASDNFLGGATGNAIAEIDLADGRLGPVTMALPGPAGLRRTPDSPATGARVEGEMLPHWAVARDMVLEAAPHFLPHRALGWDVALTPQGPVVVETNIRWLPMPFPSMSGALARLRAAGAAVRT